MDKSQDPRKTVKAIRQNFQRPQEAMSMTHAEVHAAVAAA
jgi:hypothetical protein